MALTELAVRSAKAEGKITKLSLAVGFSFG
jgi:hypothetical protein